MRTARQWNPTSTTISRRFHTGTSATTNPHHESSLGSIVSKNLLALHRRTRDNSWHRASRHCSSSIHPNLGQLENKRWVLWFVRHVKDDRHTMHRMNFGFLVSQMETFVTQIETLRATNQRLQATAHNSHTKTTPLLDGANNDAVCATNAAAAPTERLLADISDVEVQNLFYLELSRQLPLLEDSMTDARLPHLVRLITLFQRLSISKVPTVRRAAATVHDHYPDVTPTCALGQKLRLAALIENTLAEIDERAQTLLEQYNTLHKRERVDFDHHMRQLYASVQYFGERWQEDVFSLSTAEREESGNACLSESSLCRFPTLEKIFAVVAEQLETTAAVAATNSSTSARQQLVEK